MPRYVVRFENVPLSLGVHVEADTEEEAAELGWQKGEEYLNTLGDWHTITADATIDGHGADAVEGGDEE